MLKFACLAVIGSLLTQNLDRDWTFQQARAYDTYKAVVPGTVQHDLLRNGFIEDPFFGLNERSVQWVDKEDWIYRNEFVLDPQLAACSHIEVCFDGIDTYSDVYINDKLVFSTDNMFRRWRADIREFLVPGKNELKVYLHSPIKKALPLYDAVPFQYYAGNDQSQNGGMMDKRVSIFTRKAGYHYGWDWGTRLVTSGIWRPVRIEAWNDVRLDNIYYKQNEISRKRAEMDVEISLIADKPLEGVSVKVSANGNVVAERLVDIAQGQSKVNVPVVMKNPELWWPNGSGEPYRYDFEVEITKNNNVLVSDNQKIGLRSIELVREPEGEGVTFYFKVNGEPVFMKGANYIPCDLMLDRVTDEIYEETIRSAVVTNMNMLRVWGGGIYEEDKFYDLCDENGILIWQDFMFACSFYPGEGEFLESIRQEAEDNIKRLRNHPCIALWCGNNECNDAFYGWGLRHTYAKKGHPEYDRLIEEQIDVMYFDVLPAVVAEFDPLTDYTPSSPYAPKGGRGTADTGDYHFWTTWQKASESITGYEKVSARFMSEYGFQSFPTLPTVKKYAPRSKDWRIGSDVMMFHQRGGEFANGRILKALEDDYKVPSSFEDMLYMSQIVQGDAIRMAIESHRRDKSYCWGSLFWQLNDCWPVASWSSRDYYGTWKALQYYSKYAFANLLVSPEFGEDGVDFYLVSDLFEKVKGKLHIEVCDFYGKEISSKTIKCEVPANSSKIVAKLDYDELLCGHNRNEVYLWMSFASKAGHADNLRFFVRDKEIEFPESDISWDVVETGEGYRITLGSETLVKGVWVSIGEPGVNFDDNFFALRPGETKTVCVKTDMPRETFNRRFDVKYER